MKAVIMAGGFGTRIQPLTTSLPKPMLNVVNVPMVEHILKKVIKVGIKEVVILLFFKPEIVKDYFQDGKKWGVKISYILPDADYGTAGAVGQAREVLKDDSFIIISGDLVTDFDLSEIISFHKKKESLLTIALTPVENPLQFGVVITNKNDKIIKFLEKPSWGEVFSDTINTGIYIIEPDILEFIPTSGDFDFSKDLFPALMEAKIDLWGCKIEGYWRDVGNPQSYRDVHNDILNKKIDFELPGESLKYKNGHLHTKTQSLPESLTIIGDVVIGKNVKIGENVTIEKSCIADNVTIASDTVVNDCVVWDDVSIGKNCEINRAVICNNVKIKDNAEIKKGSIIAEGVKVFSNVEIRNDVTIWPNKKIEKGAIVSRNVVWGDSFKANVFNKGRVIGVANLELTGEIADRLAEAFASIFPIGSSLYVSRDYHQASGMIKRFVVGGILAVGVNALDLRSVPANVMRHKLLLDEDVVGGIHVRQSVEDPYKTEISFYTSEGMHIDSKISDAVQRIYFREQFRRVEFTQIGSITYMDGTKQKYIQDVDSLIGEFSSDSKPRIVVDLMYGMTSDIYPQILNHFDIDSIMLNAYASQEKLVQLSDKIKDSREKLSKIVTSLHLDLGIFMYPNGQKAEYVCRDGFVLEDHCLLLTVLCLLNKEEKDYRVYLPAWAPDFMDDKFENLRITKGKLMGKKASFINKFDLLADVNGMFSFVEFGWQTDAIYSSIKLMQLLCNHNVTLKEMREGIPDFYYKHIEIAVKSNKKGTIMRQFLEGSKGKNTTHDDGIKIFFNKTDWVLLIPDDYYDSVHLYIQATSKEAGEKILQDFREKIQTWIS